MLKPQLIALKVIAILSLLVLSLAGFLYLTIKFSGEEKNYELMAQIHKLAKKLKAYKSTNNSYPQSLFQFIGTNELCIKTFIFKDCKEIYYKPSEDLQDFKIAAPSFTWHILFYHPEVSMTTNEASKLTKTENEAIMKKYGTICYICAAFPSGVKTNGHTPTYRETPPIFSNPDEWPEF